ncbi:MAG: hypothetical protein R3B06_32660 [Kofleriaceae bacterium]
MADSSILERILLLDLDRGGEIVAQYNPKEFQVDKAATWNVTPSKGDVPELTFASSDPKTLAFELFFDGYEQREDVQKLYVGPLQRLTLVMASDQGEQWMRPPRVALIWGRDVRFQGVIQSISTKYTMFLPGGVPVRATCAVKMMEVGRAHGRKA